VIFPRFMQAGYPAFCEHDSSKPQSLKIHLSPIISMSWISVNRDNPEPSFAWKRPTFTTRRRQVYTITNTWLC
jgi:hypothetical protein